MKVAFHGINQSNYSSRFTRTHTWWVSDTGRWDDRRFAGQSVYCSIEGGNDGDPIGEAVGLPSHEPYKDVEVPNSMAPEQEYASRLVAKILSLYGVSSEIAGNLAMRHVRRIRSRIGRKVGYVVCGYPYFNYMMHDKYEELAHNFFIKSSQSSGLVLKILSAWIRHRATNYDRLVNDGIAPREARKIVQPTIEVELVKLRR